MVFLWNLYVTSYSISVLKSIYMEIIMCNAHSAKHGNCMLVTKQLQKLIIYM